MGRPTREAAAAQELRTIQEQKQRAQAFYDKASDAMSEAINSLEGK